MSDTLEQYEWSEWVDRAAVPHKGASFSERGAFCPETIEQALERARGAGYWEALPEAERYAERVTAEISAEHFQTTFQATYAVAGAEVDMGRFLSGEPECMIESTPMRIARMGRAVRIVVPGCYSGSTALRSVEQRGAAIVALCMVLARAQHPLEVWVGFANHANTGPSRHAYMVRVQKANEPLDEGRLMYALAHPTSNRRLCFSVKEQGSAEIRRAYGISDTSGSYGCPSRDCRLEDLPEADGTTIIVEDFDKQGRWDVESAIRWINETIEGLFSE
jgi:hypothetical protein